MASTKTQEYIFYHGEKFQVEFYFTDDGELPAKKYLEEASLEAKVKLAALVKRMAEVGKIFDITKFRLVDPKERLYEFKPLNHRFFNFFYKGRKIIIWVIKSILKFIVLKLSILGIQNGLVEKAMLSLLKMILMFVNF